MLEPGAHYSSEPTTGTPVLPTIETVVMKWINDPGRTINMIKDPAERVHMIRTLFVELSRAVRLDNNYISGIFDNTVSVLEEAHMALKVLSPNEDGTPSKVERHLTYGSVVTQWLDQLESNTGVIGCAEKELNVLGMLLADLRNKNQTPFTNRVFDRMHGTVYEANHLLTKHGFLVDEPHMFSATSDQSTKLVINPDWMDWITKRMEGQSDQFIMTTIKTAVMDEIRSHVLTPELLEIYHIEIEPVIASCTGSVTLERKDTGLNAVVSKYFKGQ